MKINISLEMLKHVFQYFTRILNSEVQNLQLLIVKQLFANTELRKIWIMCLQVVFYNYTN